MFFDVKLYEIQTSVPWIKPCLCLTYCLHYFIPPKAEFSGCDRHWLANTGIFTVWPVTGNSLAIPSLEQYEGSYRPNHPLNIHLLIFNVEKKKKGAEKCRKESE